MPLNYSDESRNGTVSTDTTQDQIINVSPPNGEVWYLRDVGVYVRGDGGGAANIGLEVLVCPSNIGPSSAPSDYETVAHGYEVAGDGDTEASFTQLYDTYMDENTRFLAQEPRDKSNGTYDYFVNMWRVL